MIRCELQMRVVRGGHFVPLFTPIKRHGLTPSPERDRAANLPSAARIHSDWKH